MSRVSKVVIIPLLLTALLLILVSGCKEKETTAPTTPTQSTGATALSQAELQQILSDAVLAVKSATSYEFTLDMDMDMEVTGGAEPGKATVTLQSSGVTDMVAKEMQMKMDMSMNIDAVGVEEPLQNMSAEMYMVAETFYMKMGMPGMGEQWVKMPFSEQLKEAYNLDMVNKQLTPLESVAEIEFVRYETLDGAECYVLKLLPNMEGIRNWFEQQQMAMTEINWDEVADLMDMFKELSYIVWIAKDTKHMNKMNIAMLMEINPGQAGVTESDFEKMTMDIDSDMIMQNYNEPVSIVLPEEAENAMEMPQMGQFNE